MAGVLNTSAGVVKIRRISSNRIPSSLLRAILGVSRDIVWTNQNLRECLHKEKSPFHHQVKRALFG